MKTLAPIVAVGLMVIAQSQPQSPSPSPSTVEKRPDFSGTWTLNARLSDNPAEAKFDVEARNQNRAGGGSGGFGGRGRGRSYGRGGGGSRGESNDAALTKDEKANFAAITDEIKRGSGKLIIAHHDPSLSITDALDHVMFFQTTATRDPHTFGAASIPSTTHWEKDHIVIEFEISERRTLVYDFALLEKSRQMVLRISPRDSTNRGARAIELKLVYESV